MTYIRRLLSFASDAVADTAADDRPVGMRPEMAMRYGVERRIYHGNITAEDMEKLKKPFKVPVSRPIGATMFRELADMKATLSNAQEAGKNLAKEIERLKAELDCNTLLIEALSSAVAHIEQGEAKRQDDADKLLAAGIEKAAEEVAKVSSRNDAIVMKHTDIRADTPEPVAITKSVSADYINYSAQAPIGRVDCPTCDGKGGNPPEGCPDCNGRGYTFAEEEHKARAANAAEAAEVAAASARRANLRRNNAIKGQ